MLRCKRSRVRVLDVEFIRTEFACEGSDSYPWIEYEPADETPILVTRTSERMYRVESWRLFKSRKRSERQTSQPLNEQHALKNAARIYKQLTAIKPRGK